jgi:hypothetical protein
MFAVRSAILVLAMGSLTSPVAASVCSGGASPVREAVVAACYRDSSGSTPVMVSLPGTSAFSRLDRRAGRLKAALEESDDEVEEADLGPVHVPEGHRPQRSIHFASRPIPTTCRLRC